MDKSKNSDVVMKPARKPRFLLLMPGDLRHELEKSAAAKGRKLTAEINIRLRDSLNRELGIGSGGGNGDGHPMAITPGANHSVKSQEPAVYMTDPRTEQAMLTIFHSLPPEKQLALLSLFK